MLKNLLQIGIVVKDLHKSMERCLKYGVGPFYVLSFTPDNVYPMEIDGKTENYSFLVGVTTLGHVRYELIEPMSSSIYTDYLNNFGEGIIHHLKFETDDYTRTLAELSRKSIFSLQLGNQHGVEGINTFNYLGTQQSLGFICELVNVSPDFIKPEPEKWYPDEKELNSLLTKPKYIGLVASNINETIEYYEKIFNLKDWSIHKEEKQITAFLNIGNITIKLHHVQGSSIFRSHFEKYGEGVVHHVTFHVEEIDEALNYFENLDAYIFERGYCSVLGEYAYIDTRKSLNFITQIIKK